MPKVKIGEVCTFLNGGTPARNNPKFYEGEIPWITSADITAAVVSNARSFITEEAIRSSATNLIEKGTILFVTRTGVGKVAVAGMDLCFSQDITAIKHNPKEVFAPYLVHLLASKQSYFKRFERGATIKGITREVIEDLEIDLPPLAEQKRIAAILDKADRLRQLRRQAIQKLDELLQSVFVEMFGDPIRNPRGWPAAKLGDVCSEFQNGTGKSKEFYGRGAKVANIGDLYESHRFAPVKYSLLDVTANEIEKYRLRRGDLLFVRSSVKRAGVAFCACYDSDEECLFSSFMIRTRPDSSKLVPEYLAFYLRLPALREQLINASNSSTITNISQSGLEKIHIYLPPIKVQREFVAMESRVVGHIPKLNTSLEMMDKLVTSTTSAFLDDVASL